MKQALVLASLVGAALAAGSSTAAQAAEATSVEGSLTADPLSQKIDEALGATSASPARAPRPDKPPTGAAAKRLKQAIGALREQLLAATASASADSGGPLPGAELRCALGILHAHAGELPRAQLHLAACALLPEAAPLRERGESAHSAVARALRASSLSPLDVSTAEPGWATSVESFAEAACLTPCTLWLPAGKHKLSLAPTAAALAAGRGVTTRQFTAERGNRGAIFVEAPPPPPGKAGTGFVDLTAEAVLEAPMTTRPAPEKHRTLMPLRYRRGLSPGATGPVQPPRSN